MAKKRSTRSKKAIEKPSCFIIMPITTPEFCFQQYKGDKDHFKHVLDCLFVPAVEKAGFTPLLPESTGSEIIHADIIEKLTSSEMVLCDMSILNANVFFELGVRTSLNKPVALIVDDKTSKIPFDIQPAQRNTYKSALNIWENDEEIEKVANHIKETSEKSQGQNALWKRFKILETAEFNTTDVTDDDKLQLIFQRIDSLPSSLETNRVLYTPPEDKLFKSVLPEIIEESLSNLRRDNVITPGKTKFDDIVSEVHKYFIKNYKDIKKLDESELDRDDIHRLLTRKLLGDLSDGYKFEF